MNKDNLVLAAASLLMLLAGAAAWAFTLRAPLHVDVTPLDTVPMSLGRWQGEPVPVGGTVEDILDATHNVQRAYHHPVGGLVWLYLGYYSTERGGTPEHTPRACYNAHGWEIVEAREIVREPTSGNRANEYVVELEGQRRLVLFWFQSFRSQSLLSTAGLRFDHVLGQLSQGRGDGALVRLSTPIEKGDITAARSRLLGFAALLEEPLADAWPKETPEVTSAVGT